MDEECSDVAGDRLAGGMPAVRGAGALAPLQQHLLPPQPFTPQECRGRQGQAPRAGPMRPDVSPIGYHAYRAARCRPDRE
jgi:hypothetical protein